MMERSPEGLSQRIIVDHHQLSTPPPLLTTWQTEQQRCQLDLYRAWGGSQIVLAMTVVVIIASV